MINWKKATEVQIVKLEAIKIILGNNEELLKFLFHPDKPELAALNKILLRDSKCFDKEQQVLIALSLLHWGTPQDNMDFNFFSASLRDLQVRLGAEAINRYFRAMDYLVYKYIHLLSTDEQKESGDA